MSRWPVTEYSKMLLCEPTVLQNGPQTSTTLKRMLHFPDIYSVIISKACRHGILSIFRLRYGIHRDYTDLGVKRISSSYIAALGPSMMYTAQPDD